MREDFVEETLKRTLQEVIAEKIQNGASEEEIEKIIYSDNIKKVYSEFVDQVSDDSVDFIEKTMYEKVLEERAYADEFLARQNQKWGKAFVASDMLYLCICESAEEYNDYVCEVYAPNIKISYHAMRLIHGRALQEYLEIICLDKNGFADGAYARWRSLYELSVVAAFIKKYGESVAEAFIKSADTKDSYEWARKAPCFKNSHRKYITFSAIQNECELATDEWKKEYTFVNQLVHASSQGTVYRMGGNTAVALPIGRTDWGMSISAIHAAISLSQITAYYFSVYHHGDSLMAMLTFHKWIEKIQKYYKEVEKECFSDKNDK